MEGCFVAAGSPSRRPDLHIAELNAGNLPILSKELGAPTERPRRLRQTFLVACVWEAGVRESY